VGCAGAADPARYGRANEPVNDAPLDQLTSLARGQGKAPTRTISWPQTLSAAVVEERLHRAERAIALLRRK